MPSPDFQSLEPHPDSSELSVAPAAQRVTKDTRRRFGRESWVVGIITFVLLLCVDIATSYPAFPSTLHLKIKFPKGIVGRSEPLVATGHIPHGDFLLVTYYSPNTLVLIHDSWGRAVTSPPITFQPDFSYALDLEMPAIANAGLPSPKQTGLLRVNVAGIDLIRQEVPFYPSARRRVFFAENPVGSTTVGVLFTGQITTIDGKILRGRPGELFSMTARMGAWVSNRWWHVVPFLLLAGSVTWAVDRAKRRRDASGQNRSGVVVTWAKTHGWFVMAAVLNGIVFLWLMSGGQFRLIYPDAFGAFYDSQAISLLQGHLDVPEWVLASEAFAVNGKYYGYFGLTPRVVAPAVHAGRRTRLRTHDACVDAGGLSRVPGRSVRDFMLRHPVDSRQRCPAFGLGRGIADAGNGHGQHAAFSGQPRLHLS